MSIIAPPQNGNQVAKRPATAADWMRDKKFLADIGEALPPQIKADQFVRVALTATVKTPKLMQCTQASIVKCLMDCAAMGLVPDGRRAHLIPYKDQCTLIIDYKGYAELVRRSGLVSKIHADVVCDGDVFEHDLGEVVKHTYDLKAERDEAKWYAVYALVKYKDGTTQAAIMTRQQVLKIRDKSQGWIALQKGWASQSPWKDSEPEMAKKTAFRRLTKWLTLSPEIVDAIQREEYHEARIIETTARPAIEATGGNDRLAAMLAPATESPQFDDGGPAPEDMAGTVEHPQVDPVPMIIATIGKAKTAEAVDRIVLDEQSSGQHSQEAERRINEAGEARKAALTKR